MTDAVCHRWNDLPQDRPMERLSRKRIIGEQAMLSQVALEKGCFVPMHNHPNEQFACVISGKMRFVVEDKEDGRGAQRTLTLGAGEVLHLPGDVPHSAEALETSVVLDVFSPPSATTGIDAHVATAGARR